MHGGPRPNSGRKKGSKARYNRELAERLKANGEVTPLDVMLAVMRDQTLSPEVRVMAAAKAAPYVHRRKPQALEVSGKFEFLTEDERELRRRLLLDEIRARRATAGLN
jgi:hypothetical protein